MIDVTALAAWNEANAASRAAYHADQAVRDGLCGMCVERPVRNGARECNSCRHKRRVVEDA